MSASPQSDVISIIDETDRWTLDLSDDPLGREPNEALRDRLQAMTPAQVDAFIQHHLRVARIYDGPGGP